jgi:hypothetical protein
MTLGEKIEGRWPLVARVRIELNPTTVKNVAFFTGFVSCIGFSRSSAFLHYQASVVIALVDNNKSTTTARNFLFFFQHLNF